MDKVVVAVACMTLIGAISWWFLGRRGASTASATVDSNGIQTIVITVNGGYSPQRVLLRRNTPARLIFRRTDPSACLDQVVLADFGISSRLPLGHDRTIRIPTGQPGEYRYTCGMNMFFGTVVIR